MRMTRQQLADRGMEFFKDMIADGFDSADMATALTIACGTVLINAPNAAQFLEHKQTMLDTINDIRWRP